MGDKVKLTREQAYLLEHILVDYSKENIVKWAATEKYSADHPLYSMPLNTLISALYVGYEVDPSAEDKLLDLYCQLSHSQFGDVGKDAMKRTLEILDIKVKGINE